MIRDIVHKRFRPDESRVERLAAMIDQQDPSSPLVHEESDRDSEDFEAEDLERGDSKASFESRAKEVGIGDALLRDLKLGVSMLMEHWLSFVATFLAKGTKTSCLMLQRMS